MPIGLFYIRSHRTFTNPVVDNTLLLDLSQGTFTRSSSGSYYNGSTSSIAWAPPNILRVENRGDGHGNLYLLEGSRTNLALDSEALHGGLWSGHPIRLGGISSPSGESNATLLSGTSNASVTLQTITTTINTSGTFSIFRKQVPGFDSITREDIRDYTGNSHTNGYATSSVNWERIDIAANALSGTSTHYGAIRTKLAHDPVYVWGAQFENAAFPTSYISTSAATATRASDQLSFASGTWPDSIRTEGFTFDLYPLMSSDELRSGSTFVAPFLDFYQGGSQGLDGFGIRYAGGTSLYVRTYMGGTQLVTSNVISFNRNQKITLTCKPNAGIISISGCLSGDGIFSGTTGSFRSGSLTIFSTQNGSSPFYGRISNIRKVDYIDLFTQGTFTRASSGSYFIANTGSVDIASLASVGPNQRRIENRGDGLGDMLLLEGSRTNYAIHSEDFYRTNWLNSNATKFTSSVKTPYGILEDIISVSGTTANSRIQHSIATSNWANDTTGSISAFIMASGSDMPIRQIIVGKDGVERSGSVSEVNITNHWKRLNITDTNASGGASVHLIHISRHGASTGGPSEWITWGGQAEVGTFPSSYISSSNIATTRAADELTFINGEYPRAFLSAGFSFTYIPDYSSAELLRVFSAEHRLIGIDTSANSLRFFLNAGAIKLQAIQTSSKILSPALTWERGQLLSFELKPSEGILILSGFTSGNGTHVGTGFEWPTGTLGVGNTPAGAATTFCYGRFGRYITALTGS